MLPCVLEALVRAAGPDHLATVRGGQAQLVQRQAGQFAATGGDRVGRVGAGVLVLIESPGPVGLQGGGQLQRHRVAHGVDALRVHYVQLVGDVVLIGQGEHQGLEGGVQIGWRSTCAAPPDKHHSAVQLVAPALAAICSIAVRSARRWPASQRLNGSLSLASRCSSCSGVAHSRSTGAE